jgi:hypothetical protein
LICLATAFGRNDTRGRSCITALQNEHIVLIEFPEFVAFEPWVLFKVLAKAFAHSAQLCIFLTN